MTWKNLDELVPFTPFKSHLGNLLGDEAQHENQDGCCKEQSAHIGKTLPHDEGERIVTEA